MPYDIKIQDVQGSKLGYRVISIHGEVRALDEEKFCSDLRNAYYSGTKGKERVCLDFSQATHLTSSPFGEVVNLNRTHREKYGATISVVASGHIKGVFQITGLDKIVDFNDTLESFLEKV